MFDLGIQELVVIFIVALIVFGPKRLPELGKSIGKGLLELRKAMEGVKEQIQAESEMAGEPTATQSKEKNEAASGEGPVKEATGIPPGEEEKKGCPDDSKAPSQDDKFYRPADVPPSPERKEDPADGR